jgi:hypothetical protein
MPIYAKKKTFKPAPEGLWDGSCIDVVDKGIVNGKFGPAHMIQYRWVVNAEPRRTDGKPHMISKSYPNSLHEKSNQRKMLETWRGRKFTPEELKKFDLESVLGAPCQIQVAHDTGDDGDAYAFPQIVMRSKPGAPRVICPDYVRECERPGYKPPTMPEEEEEIPEEPVYQSQDEDIPF